MQPYDHDATFPGTVNPEVKLTEDDLLGQAITSNYVPYGAYGMYGYGTLMNRNRPPFSYLMIRDMLADPKVLFGLWLIKGPIISQAKFEVKTNNSAVEEFVQSNLKRFWMNSAARVLKAIEWGYSASEVHYRYNSEDGLIHFDRVRDLESLDCRPVTMRGVIVGFTVRGFGTVNPLEYSSPKDSSSKRDISAPHYVGCPKGLWHLHSRDRNPWFGLSRLYGVHVPWWEQWSEDGYRSIRRLWFAKNAYEGGIIYHPPGNITTPMGPMPARDYARELIEKKRTGGILTFPNTPAGDGQGKAWEYMPPTGNPIPAGLLEYGESLDAEVLQALGIPPEIIQSSGETGFGSASGRQVPQMAFFSVLQELVQWLVMDFNDQCLRYLVTLAFGPQQYEIEVLPLGDEGVQQDPNDPNGDNNPLAEDDEEESNLSPEEDKALRSKASEDKEQGFGMSWVTIGGSPDAKTGAKHKGGTPVNIEGGKVVAGGPPAWRGKSLGQAVGGGKRNQEEGLHNHEGFDPQPHEEFERIREAVGDDPELQEGLTKFANEALAELKKKHESLSKVYDFTKKLESEGNDETDEIKISDSYQAQEGEEGEDVQKRLEARKKALKAAEMKRYRARKVGRTPEAVARAVQKGTGIPTEEYQAYEEEYWNRNYEPLVEYQRDLLKFRQFVAERTGRKDFGELEDLDVESIAEKIGPGRFPGLPGLVPQNLKDVYAPTADEDTVLKYLNKEVPKVPSRLDREYVVEVLRGLLADSDLDPHQGITDRRVMKVAMDKLNKHKQTPDATVAYEDF